MPYKPVTPAFLERCVLGTAGIGGVWGKVDPGESVQTILYALENGISAIDTAPAYGNAEQYIGEALRQWKGPRPVTSSKVGRLQAFAADEGRYDYSDEGMQRSVEQSLETLGVSALDILFLHDPGHIQADAPDVIKAMIAFKESGQAKKIGVGGNPPAWIDPYIREGVFDVVMEYNKLNACSLAALDEYLPFCLANNRQYYSASPLYMGLLGSRYDAFTGNPPSWLAKDTIDAAIWLRSVAGAHGIALPALAHRFLLSLPYDFTIVIGAANRTQLGATIEDFKSGPLELSQVNEITECLNTKIF